MNALEIGTLAVPGARLYFEVRGSGPLLLLIPGGNSDAAVFEGLAVALAAGRRVVTYDPRGYSRSPLDGPPADQRIEVHADDARRLLDHLSATGGADGSAQVFGSCSGGLVALALMTRHPGLVRSVVAHEPPAMELLPDAARYRAFFEDVHEDYRREGVGPALRKLQPLFGGRRRPRCRRRTTTAPSSWPT
ncbi:alpha/beta fold hydrolase [Streptomyces stramineus]